MSVEDVVFRHERPRAVQRPAQFTVVDGTAVPGVPTTFTIGIAMQPLSPSEVRNLPEGQSASDWRNVWARVELMIRDRVQDKGRWYTVERVEGWDEEGKFWKGQAVLVKDQL